MTRAATEATSGEELTRLTENRVIVPYFATSTLVQHSGCCRIWQFLLANERCFLVAASKAVDDLCLRHIRVNRRSSSAIRRLNSILNDDPETTVLVDPEGSAGTATSATTLRAETEMVAPRISTSAQRLDERIDFVFDVNSDLGRRLRVAELRILELATQLQKTEDSAGCLPAGSLSVAASANNVNRRVDLLFDVNSELGRRLGVAELRILHLETQLQKSKDTTGTLTVESSSVAAPANIGTIH